ncbi:hypothetical protein [Vulcanisaeta distributa]|uniref:Uncharacterized protein n=1 Tax=Vulcanisaeta distributa (strain DSM 14429 / JCM 11212 / NBRC 100878 / IC-017) TaxID=572478 RepID=E1QUI7_VULDI|nr:hypothetical protein [Vulcanisaeta distributa]ADN49913.1 hypothetical protein Vdis_0514 [Vulcanisaeta distributa DSM 14429]
MGLVCLDPHYSYCFSVIGFALITKFLRDDDAEFGLNFRRVLLQSLVYLALCLVMPVGELGFIYDVTGFPLRLSTSAPTSNDSAVLYTATHVPVIIITLIPIYAFAATRGVYAVP